MRNVSRVFLLIGGILAIVSIFAGLGTAAFFFQASQSSDETIHAIISPYDSFIPGDTLAERIEFARVALKYMGVFMIVLSLLSIPTAIIAFSSRAKKSQGLFITALIFGVITGTTFVILGAIFGLVANASERKQQNQNVIDSQY